MEQESKTPRLANSLSNREEDNQSPSLRSSGVLRTSTNQLFDLESRANTASVQEPEHIGPIDWQAMQREVRLNARRRLLSKAKKGTVRYVDLVKGNRNHQSGQLRSASFKSVKASLHFSSRHPAYARFQRRFASASALRRAQLMADVLSNTLQDVSNPFPRDQYVKSPAYIRQRIAAEYPPPTPRLVSPPPVSVPTPTPAPNTMPDNSLLRSDFLSSTEVTTIPLDDKEQLQAFYASLPLEMAQELARMVAIHAARVPGDAKVSLVLRPLPEDLQVDGKRKFEVNLKYTKFVPSPAAQIPTATKTAPKRKLSGEQTESPTKRTRQEFCLANQLQEIDEKFFLWPKKSAVHVIRATQFPQLTLAEVNKMVAQAFKNQSAAFDPSSASKSPRWPYRSIRNKLQGLGLANIASPEAARLGLELSRSFGLDDNTSNTPTMEIVEARWNAYCALETACLLASNPAAAPGARGAAPRVDMRPIFCYLRTLLRSVASFAPSSLSA